MDIGLAVHHLKEGRLLRRAGWNGKGMHIYLEEGFRNKIGAGVFKGTIREYAPAVYLYNSKGIHQPGWVCSQEDLLADDWELAE